MEISGKLPGVGFASVPLLLSFALAAGPAVAAPLTAQQTLNQFNLVVLGNATSSSDVAGRSFIGGTLSGGTYVQNPSGTPASNYAGLTVIGGASGISTPVQVDGLGTVIEGNLSNSIVNSGNGVVFGNTNNVTFNGPAYVGGTATSTNFNGGQNAALATGTAATAATSTNFTSVLTGLSTQLSQMTGTGGTVTVNSGTATFNAVANASGQAVFDLTSGTDSAILGASQFAFNLNGATTLIINADNASATIAANFLGGSAQAIGAKTIWNFYDATHLNINNQFGGSVLAPLAAFTNTQNIEGGVFVQSLNQSGEIHLQPFTGQVTSVPEPDSCALMLAGLGLLGFTARRKNRIAAE